MTEEQWTQLAHNIGGVLGIIVGITALLALIGMFVWACIYYVKTEQLKKEYIKTLNDHDQMIIYKYKEIEWKPRKRGKKA